LTLSPELLYYAPKPLREEIRSLLEEVKNTYQNKIKKIRAHARETQ
jgi:hypothetical protein